MKPTKLLLLLASLSLCIVGCAKQTNSSSAREYSSIITSSSEPDPEPDEPTSPLTPPTGQVGFPSEAIAAFYAENDIDEYYVPEIAENQAWSYKTYTYTPIMKLWTLESQDEISYEDAYCELYNETSITIKNKFYNTLGYAILNSDNMPELAFKTIGDYFVLYLVAPEYEFRQMEDGRFPLEVVYECLDLMDVSQTPVFPLPPVEEGWIYQIHFYLEVGCWKPCIKVVDPQTPDQPGYDHNAIEDYYLPYLEEDGWTIDISSYDYDGYHAIKTWVEITFFSWDGEFRIFVFKKLK